MPDIKKFPEYFQKYNWNGKHKLYGYPPDRCGDFVWINSLEARFKWLRQNYATENTASICLIREMIQWGGSQNGVLQKFDDHLGEINLYDTVAKTISRLSSTGSAIEAALAMPGMGLTYASKLLRFLNPEKYGALDNRVRGALEKCASEARMPKIYDGNVNSMINGYEAFIDYIETLKRQLDADKIPRPECALTRGSGVTGWRAADIEMALFAWAEADES
jgi:hypothetical protein